MKQKTSNIIHAISLLTIVGLAAIVVELSRSNFGLARAFGRPNFLTFTAEDLNQIIDLLQAGDPTYRRVEADSLRHRLELQTNYPVDYRGGIEDLYALYRAREQPGRSNYFCDLVEALMVIQPSRLAEAKVTTYLGNPDKTLNSNGVSTLIYNYHGYGGLPGVAMVSATNGIVSSIFHTLVWPAK